jgi:hypothetical protein
MAAATAGDLDIHHAGIATFHDDGNDTSVTFGPVGDGTTILGVTGRINATGLQVGGATVALAGHTHARTETITVVFDGGGSEIADDSQFRWRTPVAATITAWTILLDQSGSIAVDVWVDTLANYPPTDADTITNGNEPAVTTAVKAEATDLSGWSSVALTAGDTMVFNVDSCTTATHAVLILTVEVTQ